MTALAEQLPAREWRRLDRRMLLVHPVIELGRALPALAGLLLAGSGSGHGADWTLAGAAVVIVAGTLRWFTTRYRITPERVELRHGLLRRRTMTAPLDRVRTVDVTSHALHRILRLARVAIGTGNSDRKGRNHLVLDGLSGQEARGLRAELLHRTSLPTAASVSPEHELARLRPRWIWYAPFTLSGAVTALALAGFGWRVISESGAGPRRWGPVRATVRHLDRLALWQATLEVAILVVLVVAVLSTAGYLLAFWNFRLSRHDGGTLHVTRGLITTRATSIEERRLRGAELSEPLLLRAVGGARTLAVATGLRVGRGAERGGTVLLPPAPSAVARAVAGEVLGTAEPFAATLDRHGRRATRRRYTRALGVAAALIGATGLSWWLAAAPCKGWLIVLVLLPVAAGLAADRAANLGHALVGDFLVSRYGSIVRRRTVLATDAVIGVKLRQSFFQRRAGIATLVVTSAAGRQWCRVPDVDPHRAVALADAALPGLLDQFRW